MYLTPKNKVLVREHLRYELTREFCDDGVFFEAIPMFQPQQAHPLDGFLGSI